MSSEAKMMSKARSLNRKDNVPQSDHVDDNECGKPGIEADEDEGVQLASKDAVVEQVHIAMDEMRTVSQEGDGSLQNVDGILRRNNENAGEPCVPLRRGDRTGRSRKPKVINFAVKRIQKVTLERN